jgi:SAM-dependent methyltransferase
VDRTLGDKMNKQISEMSSDEIKGEVKKAYEKVAERRSEPAAEKQTGGDCCGPNPDAQRLTLEGLGYSVEGLPASVTESYAGCGNPVALASLKEGETVLDLGSGAGLDMFVASGKVGETGRVIGVDMTPAMIKKAEENAEKLGIKNVEFRLGDIEDMPVHDESVDIIISNCVINLAPDKGKVFRESYRVLRPGGRMMISDIVLNNELSQSMRDEVSTYTGCLGGAILEEEYLQAMRDAGFENVEVVSRADFNLGASVKVSALKPV